MEGTKPQKLDLNNLLLSCEGMSLEEIEKASRECFSNAFLKNGIKGFFYTHENESVVVYFEQFDHAFFASPEKKAIDIDRVVRMRWIKPMVSGQVPNIECWEKTVKGRRKRIYLSFENPYIIWLNKNINGGWKFKTAYPSSIQYLRKCIKNAKLIERFK